MRRRIINAIAAVGVAALTFLAARMTDACVLRVTGQPHGDVLVISDVILALAFGVVVDLWLNLRATRLRLTDLERDGIAMETQLSIAADIQRRLLPPNPDGPNGVRWAGRSEPAYRIGGDFYDVIPAVADGLFVIGDVSGKGIPAALLQSSAHSLFRALARETVEPAELLARVSREIYAENAGTLYLTCIVAVVDCATATLSYANAGHPAGLLIGRSGRRLLTRGGPPAGLFPDTVYESEVVPVSADDLAVIVSDGITEAIEEDGVASVDVLMQAVCRIPLPRTPAHVCDTLIAIAQRHHGPRGVTDWQDDKTVVAFLFDGAGACPRHVQSDRSETAAVS